MLRVQSPVQKQGLRTAGSVISSRGSNQQFTTPYDCLKSCIYCFIPHCLLWSNVTKYSFFEFMQIQVTQHVEKLSPLHITLKTGVITPSVCLFIPESVFCTQSVISPCFIPQSMFYVQSVKSTVCNLQSMFYTQC